MAGDVAENDDDTANGHPTKAGVRLKRQPLQILLQGQA